MVTLGPHDIMIFGGMHGKLLQEIYFIKQTTAIKIAIEKLQIVQN